MLLLLLHVFLYTVTVMLILLHGIELPCYCITNVIICYRVTLLLCYQCYFILWCYTAAVKLILLYAIGLQYYGIFDVTISCNVTLLLIY